MWLFRHPIWRLLAPAAYNKKSTSATVFPPSTGRENHHVEHNGVQIQVERTPRHMHTQGEYLNNIGHQFASSKNVESC